MAGGEGRRGRGGGRGGGGGMGGGVSGRKWSVEVRFDVFGLFELLFFSFSFLLSFKDS